MADTANESCIPTQVEVQVEAASLESKKNATIDEPGPPSDQDDVVETPSSDTGFSCSTSSDISVTSRLPPAMYAHEYAYSSDPSHSHL